MRLLTKSFRAASQINEANVKLGSLISCRGLRTIANIKLNKPEKKKLYHPSNSGDLDPMPSFKNDIVSLPFQRSKELESANDMVKKVFSLEYQLPKASFELYKNELMKSVQNHPLDFTSLEAKIAALTAKIRFYQPILENKSSLKILGGRIKETVEKRQKFLKILRAIDYKKFEWILEKLNVEYKPVVTDNQRMTVKKAMTLLTKLTVEKEKEYKLAEVKKSLDEKKVPFLQKKLEKLKWIKENEEKYNLPKTVTDEDIENCLKRIEEVKIQVAENQKRGYVRKIHPYFLEPYDEKLLNEKEDAELNKYKEEMKI